MQAEKTRIGTALTGPVCAMLAGCAVNQAGLLPEGMASALPGMQLMLAKLATPLLLYNADVRQALAGAKAMLPAFTLAAASTVAAALVAVACMHGQLSALGQGHLCPDAGLHLAAALTAKNIGGSINFLGVATALGIPQPLITAGIAADNLAALLYFPAVSALASQPWCAAASSGKEQAAAQQCSTHGPHPTAEAPSQQPQDGGVTGAPSTSSATSEPLMLALAVALGLVSICERFGKAALPATTALTVVLATVWPSLIGQLAPAGSQLANCLLYMFFASAGAASGSLHALLSGDHACIVAFLSALYALHLLLLLSVGGALLRMQGPVLLIASHANIGSAATVACLAQAKRWKHLLLPGMLAANLGNAIATFVGLALAQLMSR